MRAAVCFTVAILSAGATQAQLRIVTYNTAGDAYIGTGTNRIDTVLKAIGEEIGNNGKVGGTLLTDGIAKPIDVLILQEQLLSSGTTGGANFPSPTTQAILSLLNTAYAGQGVTYAMSNRTGNISNTLDTTQTLIYRQETVQLIADSAFGSATQPRQTLRYQLRPVGYTSNADFYIYNSHYKASQGTTEANQRYDEANAIRTNSDALGQGAHIIYAGDFNFYHSDSQEPAWGRLVQAGNGQANDPVNQVGNWTGNSSFAAIHSQSPCSSATGNCGVGGGMDDRFDFQLVSGEFQDGAGLSYIPNSYHSFGNNGSTFNTDITNNNSVTLSGVTSYTKTQVLNALHTVTDHLPVVADYQLPAIMQASTATVPATVDLGVTANLNVTVTNSAPVMFSNGADVLHYSLTTSGSASGSFLNQNETALGGSNTHSVALTTTSVGLKSATISLGSTNQGIPTSTINLPISFQVVVPGDYNNDNTVGASDYVVWRKNSSVASGATYFQGDGNRDGSVTAADYAVWREHFGQTASASGEPIEGTVPEPSSYVLGTVGTCLACLRLTRLKAWTLLS